MDKKHINIKIDDSVIDLVVSKVENNNYGARQLKRIVQDVIENKIAEEYLDGSIQDGNNIEIIEENKFKKCSRIC